MTQGSIVYAKDPTNFDSARIKRFLDKRFPDVAGEGMLVLDWEAGPYLDLRNHAATDSDFQLAEQKMIALLREIRRQRPNLKLSFYGIPYRAWNTWQHENYNPTGKYDNLLAKLDFITPSMYMVHADEEVGHERNLKYLRQNLETALYYGKKFNIPVTPFVWHRIHSGNGQYGGEIIQKEVFASYIKYISAYTWDGHKAAGVYWWDNVSNRLKKLEGIDRHLKGEVHDAASYDAMLVGYAREVKQALR
ncbi:hypothetical protein MKJ04_06225 [Pontibacter sp. E15-1]|uniref:hypothetical protein n=1 Tax=Pontibacter sp. E15-1 TaxID=2919918 RepID=UPI001F4F4603|nr:hypothetical protein [Pontibacter sp. E15-1]MCJ8164435.1 hypothetical protein [Pontibacter sp. E15-1]